MSARRQAEDTALDIAMTAGYQNAKTATQS